MPLQHNGNDDAGKQHQPNTVETDDYPSPLVVFAL